ncbi:MAG TPA: permease-like cell division protein FtsX [Chitinophagaceae bacterium]|nr:permease-like cell division protein FtsX [Chitinophagaceae bacterium]
MAKSVKSLRRGKVNYTYSVIGVAIVLFILGFMGWFFINVIRQGGNALKENVAVSAYLFTTNKDSIKSIRDYIAAQPYTKSVEYIDKEKAKQIWLKDGGEDWSKILAENPLQESIDFYVKSGYVDKDSLVKISNAISSLYPGQISDVQYKKALVANINEYANKVGIICLVIAIVLCIIVIISIDNTIRLAMFSNRFLIKTMQMVGATRGFIARPMDKRALLNGLVSALIAILLLFAFIQWAENVVPELKAIHNTQLTLFLFAGMIVIGVTMSLFSTHRSVMKYLRMKLDDLY